MQVCFTRCRYALDWFFGGFKTCLPSTSRGERKIQHPDFSLFFIQFACNSTKALSTKWAPRETMIYHFVVSKKERNEQPKLRLRGLLLRAHVCFPEFPSSCPGCLDQGPCWELGTGPVQASPSCAPGASSGAVPPLWDTPGFKHLVPPHPAAWKEEQQDCPGDLAGDVGFERSRAKVKRAGTTESTTCWRVDGTK